MKTFRYFLLCLSLIMVAAAVQPNPVHAQCAMCSLNAENSTQNGQEQGKGLNNGILFLLAMPFLIGGGIGILWYKKYRIKEERPSIL